MLSAEQQEIHDSLVDIRKRLRSYLKLRSAAGTPSSSSSTLSTSTTPISTTPTAPLETEAGSTATAGGATSVSVPGASSLLVATSSSGNLLPPNPNHTQHHHHHHHHHLQPPHQSHEKEHDLFVKLCDEVENCALALCKEREEHGDDRWNSEGEEKLDALFDDVYHVLSLHRKVVKDAPATCYVQLTTMKQCLEQVDSTGIFTLKDLEPYDTRLADLEQLVQCEKALDERGHPQKGQQMLIARKLKQCKAILEEIRNCIDAVSECLLPIKDRLILVKRNLESIASQRTVRASDITPLQEELRAIDALRVDNTWRASDGSIPPGQAHIRGLLEQLYEECHDLLARTDPLTDKSIRPIYEKLVDIKSRLHRLSLTHRWTMRENDIYYYMGQLQKIDLMRLDGTFRRSDGSVAEGQAILNTLLNRSYNLVHKLLSSSTPVAEPLIAVHNQLLTIRKCLQEVTRYGGPYTVMDVYPFQMKLASIDNMRKDGKFLDEEGNVPEGQGVVHALLSECYDYVYAIRAQIED